ncbi:ATP-binding protein [Streptomyces sp. PTM05]|uniref:ATP-binding protein n=1 Tax=Streptantibioticus parmotrematis TaxID=2873249 RepID=A0ABS7R0Q2_9ACTN|nr:ATP-binding protein [Streptantibioticus parmotrematis]MBY8887609.1 ATP-binding protein [Streptantibioticus parmotrematis]
MTTHPVSSPADPAQHGSGRHWLALAALNALPADSGEPGPTGFAACGLEGELQAPCHARRFTRSTLTGWGMQPLVDDVAVIVSELLSNALRYGLPCAQAGVPAPGRIWLGLLRRGAGVLCAVSDPSSTAPVRKDPDYLAESGRGLHVIDSLSDTWGWTAPDRSGKTVWASLSLK